MSELINNQSLARQAKLKEIILSLHNGATFEQAKAEFSKHFENVTTHEISKMEQALLQDGSVTVNEIQSLCDVHAAVFGGKISDIHKLNDHSNIPGHPVNVFTNENRRIEQLIDEEIRPHLSVTGRTSLLMLRIAYDRLWEIDKHYKRKEMLFFPRLEKAGITAPPKVMWGVDDEIRAEIKAIISDLASKTVDEAAVKAKIEHNITRVKDMIFKEDNILMPLLLDHMKFFDWVLVDSSTPEIGYFLEAPKETWTKANDEESTENKVKEGEVPFNAGSLTFTEVNALLNTVPFDMTFIDKDGHVKYFTQGKERIFDRPKTVLGRHVNMCHPPQSVDLVEQIVNSFKDGSKDSEDFWLPLGDKFVYIRYFAVRDADGNYLGTLETTQDIKPIQAISGSKRLVS